MKKGKTVVKVIILLAVLIILLDVIMPSAFEYLEKRKEISDLYRLGEIYEYVQNSVLNETLAVPASKSEGWKGTLYELCDGNSSCMLEISEEVSEFSSVNMKDISLNDINVSVSEDRMVYIMTGITGKYGTFFDIPQ